MISSDYNYLMKAFITKILKKHSHRGGSGKPEVEILGQNKPGEKKKENQENRGEGSFVDEQQDNEQIVNSLIKMDEHIKITKINRSLQGEHLTLTLINHLLCEQIIDVADIRRFLLSKSSEKVEFQTLLGVDRNEKGQINLKSNAVQFYTHYSNGLIFQFYSVRALLWKICLRYLPASKNKWISLMEGKLIHYQELVRQFILDIVVKKKKKKETDVQGESNERTLQCEREERKKVTDHPLNLLKDSKWKSFFEDRQLWHIIQKDTIRTKPNCKFFHEEYQIEYFGEVLQKYDIDRCEIHLSKQKDKKQTFYYDCLTRMIFLFLKRNQQYTYCQGMNELAALVFYSFANKNSEYFRRVAESDAYFCFQKIMHVLHKQVVPGFLNGEKYSHRFEELLRKVDLRLVEELSSKVQTMNALRILSIKWFSSFFLNEFEIDESLILWDGFVASLFGEEHNDGVISFQNLLMSLGLALVHLKRNELEQGINPMLIFGKIGYSPEMLLEKALNLYKIFRQFFE